MYVYIFLRRHILTRHLKFNKKARTPLLSIGYHLSFEHFHFKFINKLQILYLKHCCVRKLNNQQIQDYLFLKPMLNTLKNAWNLKAIFGKSFL